MSHNSSQWSRIWQEQARFDRQLRHDPFTDEERIERMKEFVLHLHSEADELLRTCGAWKPHRRTSEKLSKRAMTSELIDAFKYLIMIAQTWDITSKEFVDMFWSKSAVVQQRYTEEWLDNQDTDLVLIDIDNVLCDYIQGFMKWYVSEPRVCPLTLEQYNRIMERGTYLSAETFGMSPQQWWNTKQAFRESGAKARLPVMPGAYQFLRWCRDHYHIVLLTSRPIDEYPGMYMDTLDWLHYNQLPFDHIWWAMDKSDALASRPSIVDRVRFAVDDDPRFVSQLAQWGFPVYHLVHDLTLYTPDHRFITRVISLEEVIEKVEHTWTSKTVDTDPTPDTPTKNPTTPSATDPRTSE